ncbi:MAG TPA: hypothetical protein VN429_04995 [Methanospirillum sp.]|uniref:hypothetical protein n=1 Tax=Methanospirillum sp. TaxID=45200 RepID=UPI002C9BBC9D|nr:hypothetical protein [Methanospirillum sp.]HWQ63752.1 hypothetical protein [Methanospirillum sp.]
MTPDENELIKVSDEYYRIGDTGWGIEFINGLYKGWFVSGQGQYLPVKGGRSVTWQFACHHNLPDYDFLFPSIEEAYNSWINFNYEGRPVGGKL